MVHGDTANTAPPPSASRGLIPCLYAYHLTCFQSVRRGEIYMPHDDGVQVSGNHSEPLLASESSPTDEELNLEELRLSQDFTGNVGV
jgi:hypothetical protein